MNFIFETDSVDFVSPALIHSCAIVTFERDTVDWRCIFASYMNVLRGKLLEEQVDIVEHLVEWLISSVLSFLHENIKSTLKCGENYITCVSII